MQIYHVRVDQKEEVSGITIQAFIIQQHFNTKIFYMFTNCISFIKAKRDKRQTTLTKNYAF